jgi:hypothetical protein
MPGSALAGLFILVLLVIVGVWIRFRGGSRLLTLPMIFLFALLAVAGVALLVGL